MRTVNILLNNVTVSGETRKFFQRETFGKYG